MNAVEKSRRSGAIWPWLLLWIITPDDRALFLFLPDNPSPAILWIAVLAFFAARGLQAFLWFKIFYHWARAKGLSGWLCLTALLGPLALVVMPFLPDHGETPAIPEDPERNCPSCNALYRLGEYSPTAEQIFCSQCKDQLPRE